MLRRYRVLIWLLLGLAGLDRVVAAQARRWDAFDPHPYRERLARCRQGHWDLLIVGGSPAMCGIDPAVLSGTPWHGAPLESGFNFGLPLGTTAEAWLAAERGMANPPRLLIYGATATDFNASRRTADGPRQLMTLSQLGRASAAPLPTAGWYAWNYASERVVSGWQLYYHRRGIRLFLADTADRLWPGLCPTEAAEARRELAISIDLRTGNGFTRHPPVTPAVRLDAIKAAGQASDYFPFMERFHVGAGHLASLDRMLSAVARHGVPIVIVDLPVPADLDARLFPSEFAAYRAALAGVAAAHGVSVLRATRDRVGLTDADFSDLVHLNGDGAAKLSCWLRRALAAEASP